MIAAKSEKNSAAVTVSRTRGRRRSCDIKRNDLAIIFITVTSYGVFAFLSRGLVTRKRVAFAAKKSNKMCYKPTENMGL